MNNRLTLAEAQFLVDRANEMYQEKCKELAEDSEAFLKKWPMKKICGRKGLSMDAFLMVILGMDRTMKARFHNIMAAIEDESKRAHWSKGDTLKKIVNKITNGDIGS